MFRLEERVAVVTGGSRGIGRAIALTLAKAGAYVVVNYRSNESEAQRTLAQIVEAGGRGGIAKFDVADPEATDSAIVAIHKEHGRLDILVNNAGVAIDQLLLRVKPQEFDQTMATNLGGALWCAKAAARLMIRAKRGRIINLSSVVGEAGNPGQAVYASSKAALIGLTKTLAREYASRGITVNAVAPGYIETDMTSKLTDEMLQAILAQTPIARVGRPEEVAAAVLFLSSDEAAYVTGQVLRVNGGMYV